jgi:two-component system, sensor histidine kinase LadS
MLWWLKYGMLSLIFCLLLPISMATPLGSALVLSQEKNGVYGNSHVEYFIDQSEKMTFDEVRSHGRFIAAAGKTVLPFISGKVWFRIKIAKQNDSSQAWGLEYLPFNVVETVFYSPDKFGNYKVQVAGDAHPQSSKEYAYRQFFYHLDFYSNQEITVYWQDKIYSAYIFPLRLWKMERWIDYALKSYLFLGIYTGVMLGLALYNLILFFRLKDNLFFIYFCMVFSYLLYSINVSGLGAHVFWPASWLSFNGLSSVIVSIASLFLLIFTKVLLDVVAKAKWINFVFNSSILCYLLIIVFAYLGFFELSELLTQWVCLFWLPLAFCVAVYLSLKGSIWARYYLLGESPSLVGGVLLALMTQGVLEVNPFNSEFYYFAGAWSAVLFSQALAEKVHGLKAEKSLALKLLLKEKNDHLLIAEEYKRTLEEKVKQRTKELSLEINMHQQTLEQLRDSQSKLEEMAYSDALTGLPNRRMFQDRLSQAFTRAQRHGGEFALALIDLDHFKRINDSMGHAAGDQLLQVVAQHLNDTLRHCDTVARLGGDEFAMILTAPISKKDAVMICQRLLSNFDLPVLIDNKQVKTGMSIGLAWFPVDGQDIDELIGAADVALYQAKAAGRHQLSCAGYVVGSN